MSIVETVTGKVCGKCKEWKLLDAFPPHKRGLYKRDSTCLQCRRDKHREERGYKAAFIRPFEPFIVKDTGYLCAKCNGNWLLVEFDAEDFDLVTQYTWSINTEGYALTMPNKIGIYMHRLILQKYTDLSGKDVDHVNHIKHCNRKTNLRAVCRSTNNTNPLTRLSAINTSGYRGVSLKDGAWLAQFTWKGHTYRKGGFETKEEAAHQYDLFVIEFGPPLAKLNFPDRRS